MELALEPEPEPERQPDPGPAGQPRRVSWQWAPGAEPEHRAWEWRYFAPSPLPADASELRACREDVYFPASSTAGLKLRRGKGKLEVKLCHETCAIAGRGQAECWSKQLSGGCTSARGAIDPQACAVAVGLPEAELFDPAPLPVRVLCRKDRVHTAHGERTDCLLLAFAADREAGGDEEPPILVERWTTVSVEIGSLPRLAEVVQQTELPAGGVVGGYPAMVVDFGRRALGLMHQPEPEP